ncbi:RNA polymerase sigma-70 factor [Pedobacter sp. AW31-3R]|uniref:RNA polymerase sigma-70 factor n=1 Tax=Pedobacter sp. AW31-3R TaxID=3445781 RepID=UPI003F9EC60D
MEMTNALDDRYWMEEWTKANEKALSHFFKRYAKSLVFFTNRLLNDRQEAEDIVSGCFAKLWERRNSFQTAENIKAFLYLSCRNACLNRLRHLKVRTMAQQEYYDQLLDSKENVLLQMVKAEILEELNREIELLPENYRQVFKLIYFNQEKTDQIAARLGLSVQTVRNYKTRAVELLKTAMLKKGLSATGLLALMYYLDGQ